MSQKIGPFGLYMGMNVSDVEGDLFEDMGSGCYCFTNLSQGHAAFEEYKVHFSPLYGLYHVRANGLKIKSDSSGSTLRYSFDQMRSSLSAIYGDHYFFDSFEEDDYPENWMQLICDKDAYYIAHWEDKFGSQLKNFIKAVMLISEIFDSYSGRCCLIYRFENFDKAYNEMQHLQDNLL
ncbi:MAG: hypothetical protein FJY09_08485 [Chlorobi bacterium]|nr:hypothetical protein [Chlorobiota bacterium]